MTSGVRDSPLLLNDKHHPHGMISTEYCQPRKVNSNIENYFPLTQAAKLVSFLTSLFLKHLISVSDSHERKADSNIRRLVQQKKT